MAALTELQAELLAALLNSGISSDAVVHAIKAIEKQMKPEFQGKLEKMSPSESNEQSQIFSEISGTVGQNVAPSVPELETNGLSIAQQLVRRDPWQSAKIIKQYMQQHNIPQREAVEATGLNQSHLSQHLNKGTPMKTQKRFTLYTWFEAKQKEIAAQYNRMSTKRQTDPDLSPTGSTTPYKRSRRNRFKWGQASTEILYEAYDSQRNPSKEERELLVKACNQAECDQRGIPSEQVDNLGPNLVNESRVYNWFANRRKEEAFKVKLAMDAGTYPVVGGNVMEQTSLDGNKTTLITSNHKSVLPKASLLPALSTHLLPKLTDVTTLDCDTSGRTSNPAATTSLSQLLPSAPLARLPTMSLIKYESSPPTMTQAHTVTHANKTAPALMQRPISVAIGALPHQILTPAQLQVITGLVPGQMLPVSHTPGIVTHSGELGTSRTVPVSHVPNLMVPSHIGTQSLSIHGVTLMPMTSGVPQVQFAMSSPSVVSSASNTITTISTPLLLSTDGSVSTTAEPNVLPSLGSGHLQCSLPPISTVKEAFVKNENSVTSQSTLQLSNSPLMGASTSVQSQNLTYSTAMAKQEQLSACLQSSGVVSGNVPSTACSSTLDGAPETSAQVAHANDGMNCGGIQISNVMSHSNKTSSSESILNNSDTLVVEMKPVGVTLPLNKSKQATDTNTNDSQNETPLPTSFLTIEKAATVQEIVARNEIKEPSLTLSEEGVVNKGGKETSQNATQEADSLTK